MSAAAAAMPLGSAETRYRDQVKQFEQYKDLHFTKWFRSSEERILEDRYSETNRTGRTVYERGIVLIMRQSLGNKSPYCVDAKTRLPLGMADLARMAGCSTKTWREVVKRYEDKNDVELVQGRVYPKVREDVLSAKNSAPADFSLPCKSLNPLDPEGDLGLTPIVFSTSYKRRKGMRNSLFKRWVDYYPERHAQEQEHIRIAREHEAEAKKIEFERLAFVEAEMERIERENPHIFDDDDGADVGAENGGDVGTENGGDVGTENGADVGAAYKESEFKELFTEGDTQTAPRPPIVDTVSIVEAEAAERLCVPALDKNSPKNQNAKNQPPAAFDPKAAFETFAADYPEGFKPTVRLDKARRLWLGTVFTEDQAIERISGLKTWKRSDQWAVRGFVSYIDNFLQNHLFRDVPPAPPKKAPPAEDYLERRLRQALEREAAEAAEAAKKQGGA